MKPHLQKDKIQSELLRWFERNGRNLPWRKTQDPYAIWVSEIMLQQTQISTVIPYYKKFLKTFPTLCHLARSNLSKVLKVWEGLGYYSRARNLHRASQIVLSDFQGRIPDHLQDLLALPGIGRYTAGAILSIAYHKEAPILDGNVKRVISRVFKISKNPREKKTENLLWRLSESLIPKGFASPFNQALMDLGATLCTPKDPQCPTCPLRSLCQGTLSGNPERYPVRIKKKAIPHREAVSAVIVKEGRVLLQQRPPKGLLGGLWEFPNWRIEDKKRFRLRTHIKKEMGMNVNIKGSIGTFKQAYSHFILTLHVSQCEVFDENMENMENRENRGNGGNRKEKGKWIPIKNLDHLAMSKIHRRIADSFSLDR